MALDQRPPDPALADNLREFIDATGLRPRTSSTSYIFTCPKCNKDERLWMYKASGSFICFYCAEIEGFRGRPEFALTALTGRPIQEIRAALYGNRIPNVELFFDFELENWWSDDETFDDVPDLCQTPTTFWGPGCFPIDHPLAAAGAEYLARRGISMETAKAYGIHYNGTKTRVLFPIQYRGRLFGWQGRHIGVTEWIDPETGSQKKIPKALTSPEGLKKERLLMFADQLTGATQVIISEGPVDGIKCHLCSPDGKTPAGNVVTMGKGVSQAQVNLIRYSGIQRVYLALDPDAASSTERLAKEFSQYMGVYLMEPPAPYTDFGEMPMEEVAEIYRAAKPIVPGRAFIYLNPDDVLLRKRSSAPFALKTRN